MGNIKQDTDYRQFHAYVCVAVKENQLRYRKYKHTKENHLIPSCVGEYEIEGNISLLKTYVQN